MILSLMSVPGIPFEVLNIFLFKLKIKYFFILLLQVAKFNNKIKLIITMILIQNLKYNPLSFTTTFHHKSI